MKWNATNQILPPVCETLLGFSPEWVHPDFTPTGLRECYRTDDGWLSAGWCNDQDCWHVDDKTAPTMWVAYTSLMSVITPASTVSDTARLDWIEEMRRDCEGRILSRCFLPGEESLRENIDQMMALRPPEGGTTNIAQ